MQIEPLTVPHIPGVIALMRLGAPYITAGTYSDYWVHARLFSSTCPVAVEDDLVVGTVIALRSQDDPDDVYVQAVMTHPGHRRRGISAALLDRVRRQALAWGCRRLYLTSEPANLVAFRTWTRLGFVNVPGDQVLDGVSAITDYKGPGRTRAVYELIVAG